MSPVTSDFERATGRRILHAAVASFFEKGYHATSMREIAAQAGIQPASLYHWYGSKESMLFTIMDAFQRELTDAARDAHAEQGEPIDQIAAMVRAHVTQHVKHRREALISDTEIRALSPKYRRLIVAGRDDYQQLFRSTIQRGCSEGTLHCPDVSITTNVILVQCTGVASWYRPRGRLSLETIASIHAELVCRELQRPAS